VRLIFIFFPFCPRLSSLRRRWRSSRK